MSLAGQRCLPPPSGTLPLKNLKANVGRGNDSLALA